MRLKLVKSSLNIANFVSVMKKTILFLAAFLLSAGSLAAQTSAEGVRNVIYLIGDGMGLAQVSMLKIENGYEPTAFDRAEGVALISTYSANNRVTDSAAAGTALATGGKTNNSVLGLDSEGNALHSMMERAAERDMAMSETAGRRRPSRATCFRRGST